MTPSVRQQVAFVAATCLLALGCSRSPEPDAAPRASIAVSARPSAEAGAPIDVDYRLSIVPGAPPLTGNYWVFVHMVDDGGMLLWTDDHALPSPPSSWGTAPVAYRRTMFVPRIPYTGRVRVEAGLFSRDDGTRVPLQGTGRGGLSYDVASFEMKPASNAVFVSFGDGWHGAERDPGEAAHEWRWSTGDARLSFRNPRRDAIISLELDQPVPAVGAQTVEFRVGSDPVATLAVEPGVRRVNRIPLLASRLGAAVTVDLDLRVRPTFVPAAVASLTSSDTRELGVRVFNVHVGVP